MGILQYERAMRIEKNIPIPPPRIRANGHASVAREMEVGDSVLCQTQEELTNIRTAIYRTGHQAITRKQPDGTWRLWKVKKEDKGDES